MSGNYIGRGYKPVTSVGNGFYFKTVLSQRIYVLPYGGARNIKTVTDFFARNISAGSTEHIKNF